MTIGFYGEPNIINEYELKQRLLEIFETEITTDTVAFFTSGDGEFDQIVRECCGRYRNTHKTSVDLCYITSTSNKTYNKKRYTSDFDSSIYVEVGPTQRPKAVFDSPPDGRFSDIADLMPDVFSLAARDIFIAIRSNLLIAYVNEPDAIARRILKSALAAKNRVINLGTYKLE